MLITIDGLSGCKKTPVAAELARLTGFYHLNSGVLYRGLAAMLGREEIDLQIKLGSLREPGSARKYLDTVVSFDKESGRFFTTFSVPLADDTFLSPSCCKRYAREDDARRDYLLSTSWLFSDAVGESASILASCRGIRLYLNQLQRAVVEGRDVIVDGRDAGSAVFPDATHKFWFYSDALSRARWKYEHEYDASNFDNKEEVIQMLREALEARDDRERERKYSPLKVVPEADRISVRTLSVDDIVGKIIMKIKMKAPTFMFPGRK